MTHSVSPSRPRGATHDEITRMGRRAEQSASDDAGLWRDCARKRCHRARACTGRHHVCFPIYGRRGGDPQALWDACWDHLEALADEFAAQRGAAGAR